METAASSFLLFIIVVVTLTLVQRHQTNRAHFLGFLVVIDRGK